MVGTSDPSPAIGQKRKRPALLSVDQTLVKITIGKENAKVKTPFMLHEGLLCAHSKYFLKAFRGNFRESREKTVHLSGVSDSTMRLFQFWLYAQSTREAPEPVSKQAKRTYQCVPDDDPVSTQQMQDTEKDAVREHFFELLLKNPQPPTWLPREEFHFETKPNYFQTLARLYAFAEIYDTPQLRQDVMTVLVELQKLNLDYAHSDNYDLILELYDTFPSTTPIHDYLVKRTAVYGGLNDLSVSHLENLPQWFLVEILLLSVPLGCARRTKVQEQLHDSCNFHEHQESQEDIIACKKAQIRDGAFYGGFVRACMSEVYALEEQAEQTQEEEEELEIQPEESDQQHQVHDAGNCTEEFGEGTEADETLLGDDKEDKAKELDSGSESSGSTGTPLSHFHSLTRSARGTCSWLLQNRSGRR